MNIDYEGLYENEYQAFDMYFASLCSMQVHPGAGSKEHKILTIDECKNMAIDMLKLRRKLWFESTKKLNPKVVEK